ncbi:MULTISPECIES: hypothetical protein [unclassified Variovorax]|uniref:hypothetical protein n=1 Tax=unclassified Variovorax TaxID=663243 RepID=UPI000B0AD250|nr:MULTISPECIES: hypothetical protein [unclassified Variovorax]
MNFKGVGTSSNYGPKRSHPGPDDHSSALLQRSLRFDELLGRFGNEPHALSEHDLNELVCECMRHGDVKALRGILAAPAAQTLHTLDVPRQISPAVPSPMWLIGSLDRRHRSDLPNSQRGLASSSMMQRA